MRFCRVNVGATCSQYLLTSTIQRHGDNYKSFDPEFCRIVKSHSYVDDVNTGVRDDDSRILLCRNMKERFLDANFNIRKWRTNNNRLRNIIEYSENLNKEENFVNHTDKVLGITWNDLGDILIFEVKEMFKDVLHVNPTKRNILKAIASAYDPIGFLQPVWINLKILFQNICKMNIDWDDNIGESKSSWDKIVLSLQNVENVILNRCYFLNEISDPPDTVSLHSFSDASELEYGGCIYMESIQRSGNVSVNLVTSKSRVAPTNKE